jgi:hypothetical protein
MSIMETTPQATYSGPIPNPNSDSHPNLGASRTTKLVSGGAAEATLNTHNTDSRPRRISFAPDVCEGVHDLDTLYSYHSDLADFGLTSDDCAPSPSPSPLTVTLLDDDDDCSESSHLTTIRTGYGYDYGFGSPFRFTPRSNDTSSSSGESTEIGPLPLSGTLPPSTAQDSEWQVQDRDRGLGIRTGMAMGVGGRGRWSLTCYPTQTLLAALSNTSDLVGRTRQVALVSEVGVVTTVVADSCPEEG